MGNFFVARKASRVVMLISTGVAFDDPGLFRSVVKPKLEAMSRLKR